MDEYLVYYDNEEIPHNDIIPQPDYDIKVITKEELKIDLTTNNVILETYEDHMDHVSKLFKKLKKSESEDQEKLEILKKLENIKIKYPHVNYQKITINDNLEKIKKIYNNFRFDVIKYLGKEVEQEASEVVSNLGLGLNGIKTQSTQIAISDLFKLMNKTLQPNENDLLTAKEFLTEHILQSQFQKHKDIEKISTEIIELKTIIKNKTAYGGSQCTLLEENKIHKLTKQLNLILGITTESDNDDNDDCECSDDDFTDSADSDSNCQFTDEETKNN